VASTIDTYLTFIEADREVYRFLVRRTVIEALELGRMDTGLAQPWALGIVGMVNAAGGCWLKGGTMSRAELSEMLTTLIVDGLPFERATDGQGDCRLVRNGVVDCRASHVFGSLRSDRAPTSPRTLAAGMRWLSPGAAIRD
jgi:hypothetical protein